MALEQPTTLRVVTAGKAVEAEWRPSGVPGLALAGRPLTSGWRLVHIASARAVSRSAEHSDPEAVKELARRIASLADWTSASVAVTVPRLREQLDEVLHAWRAEHPERGAAAGDSRTSGAVAVAQVRASAGPGRSQDHGRQSHLEELIARVRASDHERMVLRTALRTLYEKLPASTFSNALESLSDPDRRIVRSIVGEESTHVGGGGPAEDDTTAVVQAIRTRPGPSTRGPAPTRSPSRPRPPGVPGSDAAAS